MLLRSFARRRCAFANLEHTMWQSGAAAYDKGFGPLTSQAAVPLLEAVHAGQDVRLLDVATGPGFVADAAASQGCQVIGVDFSSEMIELAKPLMEKHEYLTFLQGDAQELPMATGVFDAVVVAFGLLHLPSPMRCLAEVHRVLKPGGRMAFTVWQTPAEGTGFKTVVDAIATHGDPNVPLPGGDDVLPFFHFADAAASADALAEAGFARASVDSRSLPLVARLETSDDLFQMFATGTARTRAILERQTEAQLAAIRQAIAAGVEACPRGEHGYEVPMPAVMVSAQKPEAS